MERRNLIFFQKNFLWPVFLWNQHHHKFHQYYYFLSFVYRLIVKSPNLFSHGKKCYFQIAPPTLISKFGIVVTFIVQAEKQNFIHFWFHEIFLVFLRSIFHYIESDCYILALGSMIEFPPQDVVEKNKCFRNIIGILLTKAVLPTLAKKWRKLKLPL